MNFIADKKKIKKLKVQTLLVAVAFGLVSGSLISLSAYYEGDVLGVIANYFCCLGFGMLSYLVQRPRIELRLFQEIEISSDAIIFKNYRAGDRESVTDVEMNYQDIIAIGCRPIKGLHRLETLSVRTDGDVIHIVELFENYAIMKEELLKLCSKNPEIEISQKI